MSDFIYDGVPLSLPVFPKTDLSPIPSGQDPSKWVDEVDWNAFGQALTDIQGWARSAQWVGITPLASDPVPAGVSDYLWLNSVTSALMHNGQPITSPVLTFIGITPGASPGESVELGYGPEGTTQLVLANAQGYTIEVAGIVRGIITGSPRVQSFKQSFCVRKDGGVTTIADSSASDQFGDAAASTWTLVASVGVGPDRFALTFNTGSTTSAVNIKANVTIIDVA